MKTDIFKMLGSGTKMMTMLPINLLTGRTNGSYPIRRNAAWEEEKEDIMERCNWLCSQVIKEPKQLLADTPSMIGEEYQSEWAIYSCSMLAFALANIARLYPDKQAPCPGLIAKLIDIANTPEIRQYDTTNWHEDAMATLGSDRCSHMTYLSILAWMITNYKLAGGDSRYDALLDTCCETLNRRMHKSKYDLNLLSFPHKQIFIPDMLVTIVALHNYAQFNNGKYEDTVQAWLHNAKTKWIHRSTGLLAGMLPGESHYQKGITIKGSYSALACSYLSLVDPEFAKEQYRLMKKTFRHEASYLGTKVCGIKEYQHKLPKFEVHPGDAGIVVMGLSGSGMAFGLGATTYFEDWEFRSQILNAAEVFSGTVKEPRKRHYRLAEMVLVGEAATLAMRTNNKPTTTPFQQK